MVTFGCETTELLDGGQLAAREAVREVVASGFQPLDSLLPAGGVRRGSLIEWVVGGSGPVGSMAGAGAMSLACAVACRLGRAAEEPGTIVVVDRTGWFHPPAMLPWLGCGSAAARLVVTRPAHDDDEIWAIDQALRCAGVAAVLAWPQTAASPSGDLVAGRRCAAQAWTIAMRRWQLAARSSGAVGLLVRPAATRGESSWAEARIVVAPLPGGALLERRLRLTRVGGAWAGDAADAAPAADVVLDLARGTAGTVRQMRAASAERRDRPWEDACRAS